MKNENHGLLQSLTEDLDSAVTKFNAIYEVVVNNCESDRQRSFFYKNRGFGLVSKLINKFYFNKKSGALPQDLSIQDFFSTLKFDDNEISMLEKHYGGAGFTEILVTAQEKLRNTYPDIKISKRKT